MNLKIESVAENAISVQIEKEDYSVADIVHKELLSVKHVKFAGVPPPHPLIKTLTIQIHTDGSKPTKALVEAIEHSQAKVSDLLSLTRQVFPPNIKRTTESEASSSADLSNELDEAPSSVEHST